MKRPSHKELTGKLKAARRLLGARRWAAAAEDKLWADFHEMDLVLKEDQEYALAAALREMQPEDYCGSQPPERSYEPAAKGSEMFAFSWVSHYFGKPMYFKYSIVESGSAQQLFVYSFHTHRRRGKRV